MANLKELYNALKSDGAPLPDTYEAFEKYMLSGPNDGYTHRKQVYDALKADGAPLPDSYEEFSKALFKQKPRQEPKATTPTKGSTSSAKSNGKPASQSSKPANAPQAKASNDSPTWKPRPMNQIFNSPNQWTKDARAIAKRVSPNESYSKRASEGSQPSQTSTADEGGEQTPIVTPPDKVPSGDKPAWMLNAMAAQEVAKANAFAASIGEQRERNKRVAESMTQKGRDRVKAGRMLAGMAGTPTRVLGLASSNGGSDESSSLGSDHDTATKAAVSGQSPVPYDVKMVDGKLKTEWLLPDGTLTTDYVEADKAEYGAREARLQHKFINRMLENGLIPGSPHTPKELEAALAKMTPEMRQEAVRKQAELDRDKEQEQRLTYHEHENKVNLENAYGQIAESIDQNSGWNDNEGFWDNFVRIVGGSARRSAESHAPKPSISQTPSEKDAGTYLSEAKILHDARKRLETRDLTQSSGFMGGFWNVSNNWKNMKRGASDTLTDEDLYGGGVFALDKMTRLLGIEDKLKGHQELTEAEKNFLYSTMLEQEINETTKTPHGYNAAQITVEMVPFMLQMMLNPASGLSQGLAKKFGKTGLRKIAEKKLLQGLTGEAAKKYAKKEMRKLAVKTGAVTVAGELAESAVLANTLQAPKTASDMIERYIGGVSVDDKGNFVFDGDHNLAKAIYKGEASAIIENYTEMLGEHFGLLNNLIGKGVAKAGRSLGLGKVVDTVSDLISKVGSTDYMKALNRLNQRAHWDGSVGEVLEEEAGIVLNSLFTGDNKISDLWDADQQIDIVLGVGLFGGFMSGIKTVGYPIARSMAKKSLRNSDSVGAYRFADDWTDMRNQMDNADEKDLNAVVRDLIRDKAKSPEGAKAILEYASSLMKARGYEIASASVRSERGSSPEQMDIEESYDHGTQIAEEEDQQAMADARVYLEQQRKRLASSLSEDAVAEFDEDPIGALGGIEEPELRQIAADYVNARAVYDGMIQRVRDDIDSRIEQSDADIESRVHKDTRTIQPAVAKDGSALYIVGGNVKAFDDGSGIDLEQTSDTLIVRDVETGKVRYIDPAQIESLGTPLDAESEKEAARNQIRNEIATQAASNIDGKISFQPGETCTVLDMDGNDLTVTILGQSRDDEGNPIEGSVDIQYSDDDSIQSVDHDTLQSWVDLANSKRAERFEQARQEEIEADDSFIPVDPSLIPSLDEMGEEDMNESIQDEDNLLPDKYQMPYYDFWTTASRELTGDAGLRGKLYQDEKGNDAIVIVALDSNNFVGYFREYDENGNPTNRWSAKFQNSGEKGNFREMMKMAQTFLPQGHELTEHTSVSTDGLRNLANQLKHGYELQYDEQGGVVADWVMINMMAKENELGISEYDAGSIEPARVSSDEYEQARKRLTPYMEALGLSEDQIKWAGGYLYVAHPVLKKTAKNEGSSLRSDHDSTEGVPNNAESVPSMPENGVSDGETAPEAVSTDQSALARIPVDEKTGEPVFEAVDKETAWDGLVEDSADEAEALQYAESMVKELEKDVKKAQEKLDNVPFSRNRSKFKAAKEKARKGLEEARKSLAHWQGMLDVHRSRQAQTRTPAEEISSDGKTIQPTETASPIDKPTADVPSSEEIELSRVPDWSRDTPQDARERGFRRNGAERIDRPEVIDDFALGKGVEVKFGDDAIPRGNVVLIEASQLHPSHRDGRRNPYHFLDEAQPKERTDAASRHAAGKIASRIRPEEITGSVTAYTGAPSVNSRGETIQGNNRSEALLQMYENHPEQARRYKQYLIDHAAQFGLTPEAVAGMERPVLVNMLDVNDEEAIRLGQYVAQDTESGGIERIKAKNVVNKMGDKIGAFARILLDDPDEELSLSQLIDRNGIDALKYLVERGYINDTQYGSAFDDDHNLKGEAANDLRGILYHSIFTGGSTRLEEMFGKLPAKAQRAILATAFRDTESERSARMIGEIQQSVIAFSELMGDAGFSGAKNLKDAINAVEMWGRQSAFDEVTGEPFLPSEKFSNFALRLAALYKGATQKFMQQTFNDLYDSIQGKEEDTLFEAGDKTPKSLAEAIRKVLDIEYKPINQERNGRNGSDAVGVSDKAGEERGSGGDRDAGGGEREPGGEEPADSGRGAEADSGKRDDVARKATFLDAVRTLYEKGKAEAAKLFQMKFFDVIPTPSFMKDLGLIGEKFTIRYGVISRHFGKDADHTFPVEIWEQLPHALSNPLAITKYYVDKDRKKQKGYRLYTSLRLANGSYVIVSAEVKNAGRNKEVNAINTLFGRNTLSEEQDEVIYTSDKITPEQKSLLNGNNPHQYPTARESNIFDGKDNTLSADKQENGAESSGNVDGSISSDGNGSASVEGNKPSSLGERISEAEKDVDLSPTEAQKEAGNYRKGHVQVGTFDVTIENPKGSKRSGTDASGKKWETTMTHSYGYIRGTESVDGDHIDVFISSDIDDWNGRKVFVVDQYNPDDTFDEHKVMLGFNDKEEAFDAYLSNYEAGWENGRRLDCTEVNLEDFEKWIESSKRKIKPFAEYKGMKPSEDSATSDKPATHSEGERAGGAKKGYTITPTTYTNKSNKTSDVWRVEFDHELSDEQKAALNTFVKGPLVEGRKRTRGWYDRKNGGYMMRSEEAAQQLAEMVENEEAAHSEESSSLGSDHDGGKDPLHDEVKQWLGVKGLEPMKASRSAVMRYFKIGYNRAGEILNAIAEEIAATQQEETDTPSSDAPVSLSDIESAIKPAETEISSPETDKTGTETEISSSADKPVARTESSDVWKLFPDANDEEAVSKWLYDNSAAIWEGVDVISREAVGDAGLRNTFRAGNDDSIKETELGDFIDQWMADRLEGMMEHHPETVKAWYDYGQRGLIESAIAGRIEDALAKEAEHKDRNKSVNGYKRGDEVMWDRYGNGKWEKVRIEDFDADGSPIFEAVKGVMTEKGDWSRVKPADQTPAGESSPSDKAADAQKPEKKPSKWVDAEDAEEFERLRNILRNGLGQLNMGFPPELLYAGAKMSYLMMKHGVRKFAEYAAAMVEELGDAIRPHLKALYNFTRSTDEVISSDWANELTPFDEVLSFDTANFDKPTIDAMATAENVVAEEESQQHLDDTVSTIKETIRQNPDGSETHTVNEGGLEIEVTEGDFIPGVRPATTETVKPGKKKPSKQKPAKPQTPIGDLDLFSEEDEQIINEVIEETTPPEPKAESELSGDSAAYQERSRQERDLVDDIIVEIMMRSDMNVAGANKGSLTMRDIRGMLENYNLLTDISATDLQELVERAMTILTRKTAETWQADQRTGFDRVVSYYNTQPRLNARDSERLIKMQYSTPTPFGYVMGQFVNAKHDAKSVLEPSAGNGALTIMFDPSIVHVNDIDDRRLENLRTLGYKEVTAQNGLLPFEGEQVDCVLTNPPFGTVAEKVYDGVFKISSLEGQMAINALDSMKDEGRAAIIIGGNTSYRTNGSMNPKDAAFFGYLYSHYNVVDVINISGKALYARNGTGYDVRMILINGRKTGEFSRVFPPVKSKARAEQVTTFDELYKRVQDDIQQVFQMGHKPTDEKSEAGSASDGGTGTPVRSGSNRPDTGAGQRPGTTGNGGGSASGTHIEQPSSGNKPGRPIGVDNGNGGNATRIDAVPGTRSGESGHGKSHTGLENGRGGSGSNGRDAAPSRPNGSGERLAVKTDLTTEKVPYPNQSDNGFTLLSVVPAAQAEVLQRSLGEIGDVDQFLVGKLGYSSKEELYSYLAAEQIDSVALAIHQMNKGNAFIIGDMTGVGKGRQGAALIRYGVRQGLCPIYFTQKPTLFSDNYRDLADIGSSELRPFIIASNPKDANIVDANGKVIHKLPSKKEQERVFDYIMKNGKLPKEYDYVLTTYDQIKNGTADYSQNEDGTWKTEARKLPKKSKGYTTADYNGQARRDALARLAMGTAPGQGNIAILDESHTVGGDSGCGRYMQMLTSGAHGVTFLSATFAKRADNMPIYAQRTAISEAGVKANELIEAISKGGVTLQEIMSKQLVESGQMIRRERSFEGVTIDWLSVEEETDRKQREQFNEVADIFNSIRNFQNDHIKPIIDGMNEAAAEQGATVGQTQGTKDLGVRNTPFASKMYNLVNQLLFALKVDAVADRVIENLHDGFKPVISFTNTMEGFLKEAPKGVAMDEVPNFSLTLMRALDGVMRFTENDADQNSEGGQIALSQLSPEGQAAYNAIKEKIMNLSADLPISPMDAIRMKIEEAGYSVAEITGRTTQLNRTEDGRYIVEGRKDRDKKAAMRDFNAGKLDVLMINKSGSTGISLHASSKFEDQRQRVMVFAQFQSDINDEVQMRGRIDRSGQVVRGRYEYIMSTIPAEQRIQMMFKAKLKSLDANTTSSQKSKFNEMEIVDYLNKYGDEVVWEYMKEHPELSERLGDPLNMLQDKGEDGAARTSENEDISKKSDCAGKISRYLAFLSVEEQDEIFKEITEAYKVKIQLLDDAGENDLEITTMPLRAETKSKQIWHKGENPDSGNAFADNTYVEEVEVDVLKKPMKRNEIEDMTRKLMGDKLTTATEYDQTRYGMKEGEINWARYADMMTGEVNAFFGAKAEDTIKKIQEAGEKRVAKAREKAVKDARKARSKGENTFSDQEIEALADVVAKEMQEKEEMKQLKRREEINAVSNHIKRLLGRLRAGQIYVVPQDLKQASPDMFTQSFGTFVGFKFNKSYTLGSSTAIFATLDGRRKVELALNDKAIETIIRCTDTALRYSPKEINSISMDNWDSKVPTQTRHTRHIITGNLLQALVDTQKGEKTKGNLISFSTKDGNTRQGILMSENFKPADLRSSVPLRAKLGQIRYGKAIATEDGNVQIEKISFGWEHRGDYELRVPKSTQRGGIYTMNPALLDLIKGRNFITKGKNMVGYITPENIAAVVDMLSRSPFNLTVLEESKLTEAEESTESSDEELRFRPVEDSELVSELDSQPTVKSYRAMQVIDGELYSPMASGTKKSLSTSYQLNQWDVATELAFNLTDEIMSEVERLNNSTEKGYVEVIPGQLRFVKDSKGGKCSLRFHLKTDETDVWAAYNPYNHNSDSMLNDQFKAAYRRGNLVVVEAEVPIPDLESGYRAQGAKDAVGRAEWKSGDVAAQFPSEMKRTVYLSRYCKPIRVLDNSEVAKWIGDRLKKAENLTGKKITLYEACFHPEVKKILEKEGFSFVPVKATKGKTSKVLEGHRDYMSDAKIAELNRKLGAREEWLSRQGEGEKTDAEVSMENDPWSLAWGESLRTRQEQEAYAARERVRMRERVDALSKKLGLKITVLESTKDLPLWSRKRRAKGWYDKKTGEITIVIGNHKSAEDIEKTMLHEAVAHHGLRKLLGKHFDEFLDKVYYAAEDRIKEAIDLLATRNGWNRRVATEEYLAALAEDTDFERNGGRISWFEKIKRLFIDMLFKAGFKHLSEGSIGDNELRYVLWRSYQNMVEPGRYAGFEWEAKDIAMQDRLGVGEFGAKASSSSRLRSDAGSKSQFRAASESREAEIYAASQQKELNDRFNEELKKFESGELDEKHRFNLGMPSQYLLSAGFPNLPILMRQGLLRKKSQQPNHPFDVRDIENMVNAIQKPLAIFTYTKDNVRNLIVSLEKDGKHFLVGVTLGFKKDGLEINSISGLFPKENHEWIKWIQDGKAVRIDQKEKVLHLIDSLRINPAEAERIGLDLDSATKIVKEFENPAIEDENLYRDGDFTPHDRVMASDYYEKMVRLGGWQFREAMQDSMLGLKTLYEAVLTSDKPAARTKGQKMRIEDVAGYENAYLYENRMSSVNNGEQHAYFIAYMKPLLESIHELCGNDEWKRRNLTDYMMAKHGLERNAYMRNEASANGEETERDFSGLCGLTGEKDWQTAELIAQNMVDNYENDHDTTELWERTKRATEATLEKIYLSGLISEETFNEVKGMYDHYIPLRGWEETTSDEIYGYLTSKDGPLMGNVYKKAEGRSSKADDPIANIAKMADDAIRQGNRNIMKQRFLNFVNAHPSDLVSVNELWLEYNDATDEWVPVFPDLEPDMSHKEIEEEIRKFEEKMKSLKATTPDRYKRGRDARNIPYKVISGNLKEHQVLVKRNGKTYVLTINGNPRAAQALNGLTNPDVETGGVIGNMLKLGEYVNRNLSAFYTTRNPDFVVSNFIRDMLYSNAMTWVKESPRYAVKFHKNIGKLNPAILRRLLGKWENGTLDDSSRTERLFNEFMLNGGETGYTSVKDIEGHKKTIAKELKKQGSVGRKAWYALGAQLELLNRSAENCARFAAYVTSREMGRTIDRSVYDAKEISVNFNKKGSGGKFVNATGQKALGKIGAYLGGSGRLLYVFWNAGVQGLTNFARAAKRHPLKATAGASALFTFGAVIPLLAMMMGGGDGDDDDKNAYYNLPEYIRRSNICFKAGDRWITIPLPIEYRSIYGLGELATSVILKQERYSNSELGMQIAAQMSQILPLDMLEGGGGISPLIPSAVKPMTEAYIMNKGWTGLPIYKDTPFNKDDPEWTKAYQNADQHLVEFTKWLNKTSGGDDFKKGWIDINPAKLEYLLNGTFGGMVSFPNKVKKSGETMLGSREFDWRNVPLANRVVKTGDERTANRKLTNEYFRYKAEAEKTERLAKRYEERKDAGALEYAEKLDFLENSERYGRYLVYDYFKVDMDDIRAERKETGDPAKVDSLDMEYYATMRKMVNAMQDPDKFLKALRETAASGEINR